MLTTGWLIFDSAESRRSVIEVSKIWMILRKGSFVLSEKCRTNVLLPWWLCTKAFWIFCLSLENLIHYYKSKYTVCGVHAEKAGTCVWISSLMDLLASCFFFTASSSTRGLMVIPCTQDKKRVQRWFTRTKTPRKDESTRCRSHYELQLYD